jgi:hypothetical protein
MDIDYALVAGNAAQELHTMQAESIDLVLT